MQKTITRKIWKWIKIIAIIYIVLGIALYFLQDKFLFHPKKLAADHTFQFNQPFREVNLPVTEEKNLNIIQFTVPDSVRKGIVLYFHGNRNNIERYAQYAPHFTRNHFEVWMMDYPGYGKSTGKLTEKDIYADATLLYKMVKSKIHPDSIIIYGKSLGTGVATYLASRTDCKKLILETPYASIDDLVGNYAFMYPVSEMVKYHFPVKEYLDQVTMPVYLLHGTKDEVVSFSHSKKLKKMYPDKIDLTGIEKGKHNNLADFPQFQQKLDSIIN